MRPSSDTPRALILLLILTLLPARPVSALRAQSADSRTVTAGLEESLEAGPGKPWAEIAKPLQWIQDETLRAEAEAVLRHALAGQERAGLLGYIPVTVRNLLSNRLEEPQELEQQGLKALIEWLAYRWAYQPRGPDGSYHDTLGSLIRFTFGPDHAPEVLKQAGAMGIPVEAVPQDFAARTAGIILPLYAVRSEEDEGIGDIPALRKLIEWAARQGLGRIYLLPIFEPDFLDPSPYFSLSSFGASPYFIRLRDVPEVQRSPQAAAKLRAWDPFLDRLRQESHVDYPPVMKMKWEVLELAYDFFRKEVLGKDAERTRAFLAFKERESYWLEDYALFRSMTQVYRVGWRDFPEPLRDRESDALERWRAEHAEKIQLFEYVQFLFDEQWQAMRRYAHEKGIRLVGDMPGYVDGDAGWIYQDGLDWDYTTGAAPDRYSVIGQDWGHHPYHWEVMRPAGYPLAMNRMRRISGLADDVRMDYWVGYITYFRIPKKADEKKWHRISLRRLYADLKGAWEQKFDWPFPLLLVTREERGGRFPPDVKAAGRHIWAPDELAYGMPPYQQKAYFWDQGTWVDLTEEDLRRWVRPIMRMLDAEWRPGPSHELLQQFQRMVTYEHLGELYPEDFGEGFPGATQVRRELGHPRTRILAFGFGEPQPPHFHPPYWDTTRYPANSVTFTTTHDAETLLGRLIQMAQDPETGKFVDWTVDALRYEGYPVAFSPEGDSTQKARAVYEALLSRAARSNARIFLAMYQDLFGLDNRFRTTPPGDLLGLKWRDRMPMTVEDLLAHEGSSMAQETNARLERVMGDPQGNRRPGRIRLSDQPSILGMLPLAESEDGVRTRQVRRQGEKIQSWASVVFAKGQLKPGREPSVEMALWKVNDSIEEAQGYPMRLYAVLPDGARLYYGEVPAGEVGEYLLSTRVLGSDGQWRWGTNPFQEPFALVQPSVIVQPAIQAEASPAAGLEELSPQRLAESVLHYRYGVQQFSPKEQFTRSRIAQEIVRLLESEAPLQPFSELLHQLSELHGADLSALFGEAWPAEISRDVPPIVPGDVGRVFSDLLTYRHDLRERLHTYLVAIAALLQDSTPEAAKMATDLLRSGEVGQVVLGSIETNFSSTTGGQGLYIEQLARALTRMGLDVVVAAPLFSADKERIQSRYRLRDTGRTVTVRFLNRIEPEEYEDAVLRIQEAYVDGIRVLYLENEKYFRDLKGVVYSRQTPVGQKLRIVRMLSLGTLLAIREMNLHPSIIQSNDDYTALIPLYLEEGDDIRPFHDFRADPQTAATQTVHVAHSLLRGYGLTIYPGSLQERGDLIRYDLGRDIGRRDLTILRHPEDDRPENQGRPPSISPLHASVVHSNLFLVPGHGYLEDTLEERFGELYGNFSRVLRWKNGIGRYRAIPNGFDVAAKQRGYFGLSFLELGHEEERRRRARKIFREVSPLGKKALQEAFGLPQDGDGLEHFLLSMLARIERTKGHHLLVATIWHYQNPWELRLHGYDPRFEGDPVVRLGEMEGGAEAQRRIIEYHQRTGLNALSALEVALLLMPDLQAILSGAPGEGEENGQIAKELYEIAERFSAPDRRKHFAYHPFRIDASDPRYPLFYTGPTAILAPSESESFGYVVLEAGAGGVPTLHSRRGGLRDTELRFEGIQSGFEPYHPVSWLLHLWRGVYPVFQKHRQQVRKDPGAWTLWDEFRYWTMAERDFRWNRYPGKAYQEAYRRLRQERLHGGVFPDIHLDVEIPVLEATSAINRAIKLGRDPADELKREGVEPKEAVNLLLRGLTQSSEGETGDSFVSAFLFRYLPTLNSIPEVKDHLRSHLEEALRRTERSPGVAHHRLRVAWAALYGRSWPLEAQAGLEERVAQIAAVAEETASGSGVVVVSALEMEKAPALEAVVRALSRTELAKRTILLGGGSGLDLPSAGDVGELIAILGNLSAVYPITYVAFLGGLEEIPSVELATREQGLSFISIVPSLAKLLAAYGVPPDLAASLAAGLEEAAIHTQA